MKRLVLLFMMVPALALGQGSNPPPKFDTTGIALAKAATPAAARTTIGLGTANVPQFSGMTFQSSTAPTINLQRDAALNVRAMIQSGDGGDSVEGAIIFATGNTPTFAMDAGDNNAMLLRSDDKITFHSGPIDKPEMIWENGVLKVVSNSTVLSRLTINENNVMPTFALAGRPGLELIDTSGTAQTLGLGFYLQGGAGLFFDGTAFEFYVQGGQLSVRQTSGGAQLENSIQVRAPADNNGLMMIYRDNTGTNDGANLLDQSINNTKPFWVVTSDGTGDTTDFDRSGFRINKLGNVTTGPALYGTTRARDANFSILAGDSSHSATLKFSYLGAGPTETAQWTIKGNIGGGELQFFTPTTNAPFRIGTADQIVMPNLPTSDPLSAGQIWNNIGFAIVSGTTPLLPVANGGSGRATGTTAYSLIATGTTATGAQQTLASGATTEILVGGGASALPVWTTASGSGAPARVGSPTFTGTVTVPTPTSGSNTTVAASTAFVDSVLPSMIQWEYLTDQITITAGSSLTQTFDYSATWRGLQTYQTDQANGDSWTHDFQCQAGTYKLVTYGYVYTDAPKVDFTIDGSAAGTIDYYTASPTGLATKTLTGIAMTAGNHTLTALVNGKNASSSGFTWRHSYFVLIKTGP